MSVKVVVYGSLLEGLHNHPVMVAAEGKLIGTGESVDNINMYSLGGYPSISLAHSSHEQPIKVEVYEVEEKNMRGIDALEGYRPNAVGSSYYNRSPIKVKLDKSGEVIEGLVYHIDREQQTPVLTGDWRGFLATTGRW